ncbi:MAG TPA: hypothetical protein VLH86_06000 [Patescibacteria group bacterium]|nr:hypothetical protein [Patescibacteria group bacterium]
MTPDDAPRVPDDIQSEVDSPKVGEKVEPVLPPAHGNVVAATQGPAAWFRRLWPPVVLVLLVVAGGVLWWQQDTLIDWLQLRGYTPPNNIKELATQDTMTSYAQRLFYVNKPVVEDKTGFNQHCPNASKEVAVLGCFRGDRLGIYVYQVTDKRLDGIEQVTAAHEMLHQAYERLGTKERKRIDTELKAYAATVTDKTLKGKLDAYKTLEPNDLTNEMHSIFGTEVSDLPPALETYYKQYFTDRQQLIGYHDQYQSAFTQRQQQIKDYDAQLADLNRQITTAKADLKTEEGQLQAQRTTMDGWLKDGKIAEYNAAVPTFNAKVAAYKQHVTAANNLINQYNDLIDKRNAIAVQEQELLKAQDSNASSADAQ